ncbi:GNAT family N-acetyltransferase [Streptomyces sp. NPDC005899]|uniref:GNAT family N-acetyltransferase n=1 Tax=Streptomyces sp. NPDC005899 TaxID=3155716 RepID=UPI0034072D43
MHHADAHPEAGPAAPPPRATGTEDTVELRLTEELLTLIGEGGPPAWDPPPVGGVPPSPGPSPGPSTGGRPGGTGYDVRAGTRGPVGDPAAWGPVATAAGVFRLVPVEAARDVAVISRWMNDPAVAAFWELAGPESVTAGHLRPQLEGDGRSVPCLGVLDGRPMSYWEVYRADLDPLARHYPARPHDTGLHLLIGGVGNRARGVGSVLLRAVSDLVLDHRPRCARVVAEPDLRNTPSVSAFLSAGFRFSAEVELPGKRAALMVRDRVHRARL